MVAAPIRAIRGCSSMEPGASVSAGRSIPSVLGRLLMAITSMTRIKGDNIEEVIKVAKKAKQIVEKHGAEFFRLSRFHTGPWIGEWLVVTRYSSWEAYGKAQDGMAKDPAWAKVLADTAKIGQFMGRNLTVSRSEERRVGKECR